MTQLLALLAEVYFIASTLQASLKALKADVNAEQSTLESVLISWTIFGGLCIWTALFEDWISFLPLFFYLKSFLIGAISFPALRLHILVFELMVSMVDAIAGKRHFPLSAYEVMTSLPLLAFDLTFPSDETFEPLQSNSGLAFTSPPEASSGSVIQEAAETESSSVEAMRSESSRRLSQMARELNSPSDNSTKQETSPQRQTTSSVMRSIRSVLLGDANMRLRDSVLSPDLHSPSQSSVMRRKRRLSAMGLISSPTTPTREKSFRR